MGLCSDAPDYPKEVMREQLAVSEALGERYLDLSQQQQAWAQQQWQDTYALLQETLGVQTEIQQENLRMAQEDRARYQEKFQPLEDDLIAEFREYDSPERRTLESGRAQATVQQAFEAQRRNAERRLEGYGIDPSETRGQAIDNEARLQAAAQMAAEGNLARDRVENIGRALRSDALNIGRGLPSQVAQSYGTALQASRQNTTAQAGSVASGANTMGTGLQWGGMASNQNAATMSGINNMYSGQLAEYQAGNLGLQTLGQVAGTALGGYIGAGGTFGMEEGGSVPEDMEAVPGPTDKHPVMLADDEYVIPANVVRRKGTDFFDKLIEKAKEQETVEGEQRAIQNLQAAGVPVSRQQAVMT